MEKQEQKTFVVETETREGEIKKIPEGYGEPFNREKEEKREQGLKERIKKMVDVFLSDVVAKEFEADSKLSEELELSIRNAYRGNEDKYFSEQCEEYFFKGDKPQQLIEEAHKRISSRFVEDYDSARKGAIDRLVQMSGVKPDYKKIEERILAGDYYPGRLQELLKDNLETNGKFSSEETEEKKLMIEKVAKERIEKK